MKKRMIQRWSAFLLSVAVTATVVCPIRALAEEGSVEPEAVSAEELAEEDMAEDFKEEKSLVGEVQAEKSQAEKAAVPEVEEQEELSMENEPTGQTENYDYAPQDADDVTPPEIQKVELEQQGQTLKPGDELVVKVWATDDTGLREVGVALTNDEGDYYYLSMMNGENIEYDGTAGCYVVRYRLPEGISTERILIYNILAEDLSSNLSDDWKTRELLFDETSNDYRYWVNVSSQVEPLSAKELTLDQDRKTIDANTEVNLSVVLEEEIGAEWKLTADFENEQGGTMPVEGEPGASSIVFNTKEMYGAGYWRLKNLFLYKTNDFAVKRMIKYSGVHYFYVKEEMVMPTVKDIVFDKKEIAMGETTGITLYAGEDTQSMPARACINFETYGDYMQSKPLELEYDGAIKAYKGTLSVDGLFPGEWYVCPDVVWLNEEGNMIGSSLMETDWQNFPYYVYILDENGNKVEESGPVKLVFYQLVEAEGQNLWVMMDEKETEVKRHETISEAGITLPTSQFEFRDFKWTGWQSEDGKKVTEETELFPGGEIHFYATYDKTLVNLNFEYFSEDGTTAVMQQEQTMEGKPTYGDIRRMVQSGPKPEQSYQGLQFIGWKWNEDSAEADEKAVEAGYYEIAAQAVYDKNYVNVEISYPNKDSLWEKKNFVKIVEDEDTTYAEVLESYLDYQPENMADGYGKAVWSAMFRDMMDNSMGWPVSLFGSTTIQLTPHYDDTVFIHVFKSYPDEEGEIIEEERAWPVKKGGILRDVINELMKPENLPKIPSRFSVIKWNLDTDGQPLDKPLMDEEYVFVNLWPYFEDAFIRGDVTGDGEVNIQDLRLVLRYVCRKITLDERQIRIADVEQNDGEVNIQDLRKILRFVCRKIDEL